MVPPRRREDYPEAPIVEQLMQNLQQLTQITQLLGNAMVQNNQRGQPDLVRRVAGQYPPFYAGEEDPAVLEEWIRAFDKILEAVECPPGRQVEMASFYLKEEADLWWVHGGPVMRQESGFGWETFKDRLRARFYPAHVKAAMQEEFLHLHQGTRTVQEYHRRFLELARFAPTLAPTEETRIERFVAGLNLETRMALVVFKFQTLSEAYSSAADHYRVLSIRRGVQDRSKRPAEGGAPDSKRHRPGGSGMRRSFQQGGSSHGGGSRPSFGQGSGGEGVRTRHFHCRRCGRDHPGRDCEGQLVECFSCGLRGYKAVLSRNKES
ncbi:uncharacterized protein LOC116007874 [Ipomoea triloba]|uniref:uncharacterized protein LOC116007874 n=1 Tax=Ipomoea triloba TaxID=35885 RepID=UPI00125D75AD|nr:uncharacterized protein LOC116007874 [Ipomoea triloba]